MSAKSILDGYRGHVDAVEPVLAGWVGDVSHPGAPVSMRLRIDDTPPIAVVADRPRPDVAAAGLAGTNCGFAVKLPAGCRDGAEHRLALLLPDGRDLDLPGLPPIIALGPVPADIVPAQSAAVAAVAELLRRTDRESGFDPQLIGDEHAAAFNAIREPAQGFLSYARAGQRLVGYGRLDRSHHPARASGVVGLTVLEAYRRKGLGEALLRALQAAAAAGGVREVWLSVRPDNAPATRLYEKLGFRRQTNDLSGQWAVPGENTMVWTVPAPR